MAKYSIPTVIFGLLYLTFICCNVILTPLLYDSLNPTSSDLIPVSHNASSFINITSSTETWRVVDPIVALTVAMAFDVVCLGTGLGYIKLFQPSQITDREMNYPKKYFIIVGAFQAAGGVMWQYSASGLRVAPYLQPILGSASVPIVFTIR